MVRASDMWRAIHDPPPWWLRLLIGFVASSVAVFLLWDNYADNPRFTADFGQWHLAARTLLNGENPYLTNGPGLKYYWPWAFTYPAPAILLVLPFAWLTEVYAGMLFVGVSTLVMVLAITRKGLFLVPLLFSVPFHMSAELAQWSLILTAAVFYQWLGFLLVVKPQAGLPVVMAIRDRQSFLIAAAVGAVLLAASLALLPDWPRDWFRILSQEKNNEKYLSPLGAIGGFLLPLALLKWRRREAWLLLGMAVIPQSLSFYFLLPLFTIPRNVAESMGLVLVSTFGIYLGIALMPDAMNQVDFYHWSNNVAVLSTYIPCLFLLLLRANVRSSD